MPYAKKSDKTLQMQRYRNEQKQLRRSMIEDFPDLSNYHELITMISKVEQHVMGMVTESSEPDYKHFTKDVLDWRKRYLGF